MNNADAERQERIEAALGYRFRDRALLDEALTHRSFLNEARGGKDNQRLEFYGDAVLDFLLSGMLLSRFPGSREGELTRLRAALVDEESLGRLAVALDLGQALRLGRGEEKSGGRTKRSLLADAYEALLAAIYLDGGLEPVTRVVAAHFGPLIDSGELYGRDHKTFLQELVQTRHGLLPSYRVKETTGPDHDRRFTVEIYLGEKLMGEGTGRSKKEAEQAAARAAASVLKES
ncbi:ribonuclease III [Geomesophilobacter sediminis]|uniref:Ribonuclease 3 n=1 Tax=Geomesophilobacter sediminis TaxID=2798584 RepID=A0A8J7SBB2_9BACT|nr:ribonuclease III [Geomesophilobacter sediminis]MBJ6727716.1 ribonuclease III [Geomesophilobacter sediminis]